MYDELAYLVPVTETVTSMGDTTKTEGTKKAVFCRVKSYSLKEKLMVGTEGHVPEMTFVLSDKLEYNNEPLIEYKTVKYRVIHVAFDDLHSDIGLVVTKWQP